MPNAVSRSLNRLLAGVLQEKRIFIRTDSATKLLHLTPVAQLGLGALLVAGLAGSIYSASKLAIQAAERERMALATISVDRAFENRIADLEAERDALIAERDAAERHLAKANGALSDSQDRLLEALSELTAVGTERTRLEERVAALQADGADARRQVAALTETIKANGLGLFEAVALPAPEDTAGKLSGSLLSDAVSDVILERDTALETVARLDGEVARLSSILDDWRTRQDEVLSRLELATTTGLGGLEAMLRRVDVNIDDILAKTRAAYVGEGGPFEPLSDEEASIVDDVETDTRLAALMTDLERVNLMRVAVDRLPFGMPVVGARLTSGFGKRRDPFGRGWSMHTGVDYAAPIGTPIRATAEGVVTFSGVQRGYGRIVTIKHAFGYETRYAHLSQSLVKVGDRVKRGDLIAKMGNTGRSTGSHLHYEIRVDSDPINPSKFIEAARDVL